MGSYSGFKCPKIIKNHTKIGYFSHILGIGAISTIHGIKFLIGTYMIECFKDKIIINRASGVYLGSKGPKHHQNTQMTYFSQFWVFFGDFLDLWSSDMTLYPTPYEWLSYLCDISQCMYQKKTNLIECMGYMALTPKICEKLHIFVIFKIIFWTFGARIWPHMLYSRRHMNDYFIYGTLNQLCMYQWEIWFNVWVIWL